ncbi:hypothetical protein Nepgr_014475 [Nepenthes gracilis]|uniref:WRKY domain-containing protein n=1 Tax=Nepenthes gracilis TaxID=150966 RepID=A0AAD3SKV9_NEPGR|nr:hypothetical protein Nepgr_014475 [Nepenthes gracilis]
MDRKFRSRNTIVSDQDDPQSSSENCCDSPLSGDDVSRSTAAKKSRRSIKKRTVAVPIGEADGSRGKGEAYPPSDSWAWRKYGQKPIKGSPYPRGYYRCSSSKGCPARKQVERSRVDPSMLIITYASEHNHPFPTSKHHHAAAGSASNSFASAAASTPSSAALSSESPAEEQATAASAAIAEFTSEEKHVFAYLGGDPFLGNSGEFGWLSDVSLESPAFVEPKCDDSDVAMSSILSSMREEDESLFADLGELPECSAVFRRGAADRTVRWDMGASAPVCGSTG